MPQDVVTLLEKAKTLHTKCQVGIYVEKPEDFAAEYAGFHDELKKYFDDVLAKSTDNNLDIQVVNLFLYVSHAFQFIHPGFLEKIINFIGNAAALNAQPWVSDENIESFVSGLLQLEIKDSALENRLQAAIKNSLLPHIDQQLSKENAQFSVSQLEMFLCLGTTYFHRHNESNPDYFDKIVIAGKEQHIAHLILGKTPVIKLLLCFANNECYPSTESIIFVVQQAYAVFLSAFPKSHEKEHNQLLINLWLLAYFTLHSKEFRVKFFSSNVIDDLELVNLQVMMREFSSRVIKHFNGREATDLHLFSMNMEEPSCMPDQLAKTNQMFAENQQKMRVKIVRLPNSLFRAPVVINIESNKVVAQVSFSTGEGANASNNNRRQNFNKLTRAANDTPLLEINLSEEDYSERVIANLNKILDANHIAMVRKLEGEIIKATREFPQNKDINQTLCARMEKLFVTTDAFDLEENLEEAKLICRILKAVVSLEVNDERTVARGLMFLRRRLVLLTNSLPEPGSQELLQPLMEILVNKKFLNDSDYTYNFLKNFSDEEVRLILYNPNTYDVGVVIKFFITLVGANLDIIKYKSIIMELYNETYHPVHGCLETKLTESLKHQLSLLATLLLESSLFLKASGLIFTPEEIASLRQFLAMFPLPSVAFEPFSAMEPLNKLKAAIEQWADPDISVAFQPFMPLSKNALVVKIKGLSTPIIYEITESEPAHAAWYTEMFKAREGCKVTFFLVTGKNRDTWADDIITNLKNLKKLASAYPSKTDSANLIQKSTGALPTEA